MLYERHDGEGGRGPRLVSGNRAGAATDSHVGAVALGRARVGGTRIRRRVVVDELPLSVVVELLPESVDELELSLVCACATIAPPPTIAPASPSDTMPLRIHFCMCITSSRVRCRAGHPTRRAL